MVTGPLKLDSGPARFHQHDAFTSLVDIAAAQPSLPVPKEEPKSRIGLPRGRFNIAALESNPSLY